MADIHKFRPAGDDGSGEPPRKEPPIPRRLAAIIVGDIASYSRLMQHDEEGTHARVRRIHKDLIGPSITEHHGRLVKTTGDGFIAIFDSPVEAVRCSIVIQQNLIGRNASLPKDSRLEYRIGVNLGDVIVEADDVYGDGVNIASRIEGLAQPGQVYISGAIYEQIKHKVVCGYESIGDRKVKNITDPVRIYRVLPDAVGSTRRSRETVLITLLGLTVTALAASALWYLVAWPGTPPQRHAALPGPLPTVAPPSTEAAPPAPAPQTSAQSPIAPEQPRTQAREPEMVLIRAGAFQMGSNEDPTERPAHPVRLASFFMAKYPVTVREWNACSAAAICRFVAPGDDDEPVRNVSWTDAKQYVGWLAKEAGKAYRLPTEAEWEYAARGGTQTRYWWGDQPITGVAACKDCGDPPSERPPKVGAHLPNPFGLYGMGGSVDQWVEDCWHRTYQGAPSDGSAWLGDGCASHVIRSGSWKNDVRYVRPSNRDGYDTDVRYPTHGFRVALGS